MIGYLILVKQDGDLRNYFAQPSEPAGCNATKKDGTSKAADEDKVCNIKPKQCLHVVQSLGSYIHESKQVKRSNEARKESKYLGGTSELLTMTDYMASTHFLWHDSFFEYCLNENWGACKITFSDELNNVHRKDSLSGL